MLALVVDDSSTMRRIIGRVMTGLGFEVAEAEHGLAALEVLTAGPVPSVALIDWNMPVMDGLELIHEIRAREEWRDVSLMMVTTESEQNQIVRALAAGAHEYLIKPFTPDAMVDKLELLGLIQAGSRS